MNIREQIQPIVLRYNETGWTEKTVACLIAAGFKKSDIVYADRKGVGNMSKAFNEACWPIFDPKGYGYHGPSDSKNVKRYFWFLTNVTFPEQMPLSLLDLISSDDEIAAVHPAFDSDHAHIKNAYGISRDAPFIEWTAPLIRTNTLYVVGWPDEKMPYWGMDLDWSYRAREKGYTLAIDGCHRLGHTYLRLTDQKEPITLERERIRKTFDRSTEERLIEKYGADWMQKLWPNHPHVLAGKKTIHV